ncbi:MAG: septal ring lytic transglycosylase RlpA family protein, partial [Alphaproteobacteria bacterium]|nr:septal ring lytic transglycosylase RlpA family protein [Alphaproteobacteria bacterium]
MSVAGRLALLVLLAGFAAGCAVQRGAGIVEPSNQGGGGGGVYKVGNPYQIDGTWYYPREQPDYDETGIASWYGPTFYGHKTANGEMYDGNQLTAAHKTLPMPVNVRVTNLDNGKSLVVRVNDRGPYARGRIIDLSKRAAELLDVVQTGTARVRVTYLSRADINGAPPSITPPAIANALPAAPAGKVDTAAL